MPISLTADHVEVRIRVPSKGFVDAIDLAARRLAVTRAGYVRLATVAALRADGIDPQQAA